MPPQSRFLGVAVVLAVAACLTIPVFAEYVIPETENVPVDRLAANLVALIDRTPDNLVLTFSLARLHAMAFASKRADLPATKSKAGVYFAPEAPNVPYGLVRPGTPEQQAEARMHLRASRYQARHYCAGSGGCRTIRRSRSRASCALGSPRRMTWACCIAISSRTTS